MDQAYTDKEMRSSYACTCILRMASHTLPNQQLFEIKHAIRTEFIRCLMRSAPAVLKDFAAASLFSFSWKKFVSHISKTALIQDISVFIKALACECIHTLKNTGFKLTLIEQESCKAVFLLWCPQKVGELLGQRDKRLFLNALGNNVCSVNALISDIYRRLQTYYHTAPVKDKNIFPHEIGLLFGYPLADVKGFMSGAQETCRGPWKAYSDKKTAQRRFACLSECKKQCRDFFQANGKLNDALIRQSV